MVWPERAGEKTVALSARLRDGVLEVTRPDGKTDHITLTDTSLELAAASCSRWLRDRYPLRLNAKKNRFQLRESC